MMEFSSSPANTPISFNVPMKDQDDSTYPIVGSPRYMKNIFI